MIEIGILDPLDMWQRVVESIEDVTQKRRTFRAAQQQDVCSHESEVFKVAVSSIIWLSVLLMKYITLGETENASIRFLFAQKRGIEVRAKQNMNQASQWRLALAQKVAPIIVTNPRVQAVMLAGSASRGWADSFSDIEIGVFWTIPPTDEERMAPIAPAGGVFWELDPYDPEDEIWMEEWGLGGIKMDVRNLTVERMERLLRDVVDHSATSPFKQATLSAVEYAIPLYNAPLLEQWKNKLAHYPDELAHAVVREYMQLDEWCWWVDQLISREDWPLVYQSLCDATFQILSILMGLNRMYHPGFKWMNRWIGEMHITPPDLAVRIHGIFRIEPLTALQEAQKLVLEVYDLVSRYMPEVDIHQAKTKFLHWREQFESAPAGVLSDQDIEPD